MQTSKTVLAMTTLTCALFAATAIHCGETECDQYSDCAQGFTCTAGACVAPPTADASADAHSDHATDSAKDGSLGDGAPDGARDGAHDGADSTDEKHDGAGDSSDHDVTTDGSGSDAMSPDAKDEDS